MNAYLRIFAIFLLVFVNGCAGLSSKPQVTRIVPVVVIDLVGTDLFRLGTSSQEVMTSDQLMTYFHTLFSKHDFRLRQYRYSIMLRSYDCPPPDTVGNEAKHIAPVLAAANQYGCSVAIVYPEQAGPAVIDAYYESFPSSRRKN